MPKSKPSVVLPAYGPPYFEFCLLHPPPYDDIIHTIDRLHGSGEISWHDFMVLSNLAHKMFDRGVLN